MRRAPLTDDYAFHATLTAESGVSGFIVERVLGHADHSATVDDDRGDQSRGSRQRLTVLEQTVGSSS